jgi:hypothetical protein
MKKIILRAVFASIFVLASFFSFSQCDILNRVAPDKSMQYYMEPVNFYRTAEKSLKGCIVTDKENYFLELYPQPFPEKPAGTKLKGDILLKLGDGNTCKLNNYDCRYLDGDTVLQLLYLINKDDVDKLLHFKVEEVKIDMKGDEGVRTYLFKLHKSALMEQLACFLNEEH